MQAGKRARSDQGVVSIEDATILQLDPFARMGTTVEITRSFGGKKQYQAAIQELKQLLYDDQVYEDQGA